MHARKEKADVIDIREEQINPIPTDSHDGVFFTVELPVAHATLAGQYPQERSKRDNYLYYSGAFSLFSAHAFVSGSQAAPQQPPQPQHLQMLKFLCDRNLRTGIHRSTIREWSADLNDQRSSTARLSRAWGRWPCSLLASPAQFVAPPTAS